jgi:hypothetical protein
LRPAAKLKTVGDDGIEQMTIRSAVLAEDDIVDRIAEQDLVARIGGREIAEGLGCRLETEGRTEIEHGERRPAHEKMQVAFDEARQQLAPAGVDNTGLGAGMSADGLVCAEREDAAVRHGDRGHAARREDRAYPGVCDDQVGRHGMLRYAGRQTACGDLPLTRLPPPSPRMRGEGRWSAAGATNPFSPSRRGEGPGRGMRGIFMCNSSGYAKSLYCSNCVQTRVTRSCAAGEQVRENWTGTSG